MAKISAKSNSSQHAKIIKLRQRLDFCNEEINSLEAIYREKINAELDAFVAKSHKKLSRHAFAACDKAEYAQKVFEDKLKAYDKKAYMQQRAANHAAAKAIFGGGDTKTVLAQNRDKIDALRIKRKEYISKLDAERAVFLRKHNVTNDAQYKAHLAVLKSEYDAKKAALEKKYAAKMACERASLEAKAKKARAQLDAIKPDNADHRKLDSDVLLSVRGLKMYFGGLKAVDDLDFDVKRGEIFGLIGPNGAGKTTVFNCLTQFYKPTAGDILFAPAEGGTIRLTDYQVHDIVLKGISRTFQNIEVVKEVSVIDNLLIAATRHYTSSLFTQMFHLPLLSREEKKMRARADKILKYMDLYAYRDRLAWGLPYGVLKRIEIARALMCNPELIILDEPAAGLNESETADLAALINKIRTEMGCTILLVEHDMSLVMNICDHICAISFGRKLAYGTPAEVQASKEVQEAYLGSGGE